MALFFSYIVTFCNYHVFTLDRVQFYRGRKKGQIFRFHDYVIVYVNDFISF